MGMIGYFAEIDSEKINQLLESTEKPLMDNITKGFFFIYKLSIKDVILSLFIMSYECLFYYGC